MSWGTSRGTPDSVILLVAWPHTLVHDCDPLPMPDIRARCWPPSPVSIANAFSSRPGMPVHSVIKRPIFCNYSLRAGTMGRPIPMIPPAGRECPAAKRFSEASRIITPRCRGPCPSARYYSAKSRTHPSALRQTIRPYPLIFADR